MTNTGNVTLTNVFVTDALSPNCNETSSSPGGAALASMAAGASFSYNCSLAGVTAGFTNVAVATGTPPNGRERDRDRVGRSSRSLPPVNPAISITKLPASQTIASGGTATFTIDVTNTGNVTLSNVFVADAITAACNETSASAGAAALASMAPGASFQLQLLGPERAARASPTSLLRI